MATRIQVRRDTAANWAAASTTVLASGEIGFESDTLQFKIGDGAAQWQNLEYAGGTTPIRQNAGGTTITDLNDASLRNNGNGKYLFAGADASLANEPSGLSTATDGQLMVTVAKYDYTGTSSANERYLMTLTTLTTGKTYYRTYNGGWSSWYLVITTDSSNNATVPGDLAVNGGDITTSAATATVFNTNATTLSVGEAATTVSIGATTGTATIRNATTAITGNATVGGSATVGTTLGVTGNTTLTGDLAVNGSDITTTSTGTATVFNANALSLCLGEAAPTVSIGAATGTTTVNNDLAVNGGDITTNQTTATVFNTTATTLNVGWAATALSIGATTGTATIRNATTAINGAATVGSTLGVTGNTTLTGDLAVNGGDITTTSGTATVFDTAATTLSVGGAATTVSIGATTGTTTVRNDLAVTGADITTSSTGTATVFNTNATTLNVGGAATAVSIGAATGTTTVNNDLAVTGGDITTSAATATVFDSNATSVDIAGAATTLNIADAPTTNQTINIGTGLTASGQTKTINIGTGGDAGSTTNINLGDADGGSVNIARDLAVDTNVLKVDATNNRVGINKTSPTQALDVVGNVLASGTFNGFTLANMCAETKTNYLHFNTATTGVSQVGSLAILSFSGNVNSSANNDAFVYFNNATGQTSASTYVIGSGPSTTLSVIVGGGVTWTTHAVGDSIALRPASGTWTYVVIGANAGGLSDAWRATVFAVRTA